MSEDYVARKMHKENIDLVLDTEKPDKTLQRERLMELQAMAQTGRIHGLLSLDPDPSRSFSANPFDNPFSIDRRTWPKGTWSFEPRIVVYYKQISKKGQSRSSRLSSPNGSGWVQVVELMEARIPDVLRDEAPANDVGQSGALPGKRSSAGKLRKKRPPTRHPDWTIITRELSSAELKKLQEQDFRVFPVEPKEIYTDRTRLKRETKKAELPPAFQADYLQPSMRKTLAQLVVTSTDWDAKGGEQHFTDKRSTVLSTVIHMADLLRIEFAPGARISIMLRDVIFTRKDMDMLPGIKTVSGPKGAIDVPKTKYDLRNLYGLIFEMELDPREEQWISVPRPEDQSLIPAGYPQLVRKNRRLLLDALEEVKRLFPKHLGILAKKRRLK
jgi:hypothetical protein